MNIKELIRPNILNLTSYSCARDEFQGQNGIFLDANESPFENGMNRYPDPYQSSLKKELATRNEVSTDEIFIGNGSDETLDLLVRAFCEPKKEEIIICPPTYGMYKVIAAINDVRVKEVPLTASFELNKPEIIEAINDTTKLLFICSPNNPTGNDLDKKTVLELAEIFKGIIVVDEAYIDFSDQPSFLTELKNYPNLFITQTFSKSYGAAGLRLGMGFGSAAIVNVLNSIKPPYNVNVLSQNKGLAVLKDETVFNENLKQIKNEKERLYNALKVLKSVIKIYPSAANFWLVEFKDAELIWEQLCQLKIVVRSRTKQLNCANTLRISVGTSLENNTLIEKLKQLEN